MCKCLRVGGSTCDIEYNVVVVRQGVGARLPQRARADTVRCVAAPMPAEARILAKSAYFNGLISLTSNIRIIVYCQRWRRRAESPNRARPRRNSWRLRDSGLYSIHSAQRWSFGRQRQSNQSRRPSRGKHCPPSALTAFRTAHSFQR